jgi:hypothetical protein
VAYHVEINLTADPCLIITRLSECSRLRNADPQARFRDSYDVVWWLSVFFGVASALINLPIVEKPVTRLEVAR